MHVVSYIPSDYGMSMHKSIVYLPIKLEVKNSIQMSHLKYVIIEA